MARRGGLVFNGGESPGVGKRQIAPAVIEDLQVGEVFVFGSNEAGAHGKGAALTAFGES